ncbi:uncharacterized protein [Periplaneta americana]|uniref:uncharacterized protein n=1 Tax=Periplaneta americana TaxID=6978 RepID=UPI0037E771E2
MVKNPIIFVLTLATIFSFNENTLVSAAAAAKYDLAKSTLQFIKEAAEEYYGLIAITFHRITDLVEKLLLNLDKDFAKGQVSITYIIRLVKVELTELQYAFVHDLNIIIFRFLDSIAKASGGLIINNSDIPEDANTKTIPMGKDISKLFSKDLKQYQLALKQFSTNFVKNVIENASRIAAPVQVAANVTTNQTSQVVNGTTVITTKTEVVH